MPKSPSRVRYEEENPTITVRLTKELKKVVDSVRGDSSYADVIKDALTECAIVREKAYDEARKAYKYQIVGSCYYCGQELVSNPGDAVHRDVQEYLRSRRWAHKRCSERY